MEKEKYKAWDSWYHHLVENPFERIEGMGYVYVYRDPETDEVKYVGSTNWPARRRKSLCYHYDEKVVDWYRHCMNERKLWVTMSVVRQMPLDRARKFERRLIRLLRVRGASLLNIYPKQPAHGIEGESGAGA